MQSCCRELKTVDLCGYGYVCTYPYRERKTVGLCGYGYVYTVGVRVAGWRHALRSAWPITIIVTRYV